MPQSKKPKRNTSRGVVMHDGTVLLIERWRTDENGNKLHYFSVPGGKIEPGETPEVTVVRELYEETSILSRPTKMLATQTFEDGHSNTYFLCDYLSGGPKPHASMPEHQSKNNRSKPRWVGQAELESLKLNDVYEPVRQLLVKAFKGDLPENPLNIK